MSLERELRALEPSWPATPDVAAAIADRLEPRGAAPRWRILVAHPALRTALVALLVLVVAAAAVPPVRAEIKELLGFGGAQIVYGTLADRFGRKPVLLVGVGVYAVASFAAAYAWSFDVMMAARILQGVGAAATRVLRGDTSVEEALSVVPPQP